MKRLSSFLLAAVIVAVVAYGATYYFNAQKTEDQWTWLRREFQLTDAQLNRIKALHEAYNSVCADHCHRITSAQARLRELTQAGKKDSPGYAAMIKEWEDVKEQCNAATLHHLLRVAAEMPSGQGRRYLDLMVPHIALHDHREPRSIR